MRLAIHSASVVLTGPLSSVVSKCYNAQGRGVIHLFWWKIFFIVLLLILSVGGVLWWFDYQSFITKPLVFSQPRIIIFIPQGESLAGFARRLQNLGKINPFYFIIFVKQHNAQGKIKAGEYEFTSGITPAQILDQVTAGRVIEYPVTLIEGWTMRQVLATLDAHPQFGGAGLTQLSSTALMERLGHPDAAPEGHFFPDTYLFPRETTEIAILQRAWNRMEQVLAEEWQQRRANLPLANPYQALILASLIEKETACPAERARIAAVFIRRLRIGMRLQTDPTVIYGLGARYTGVLHSINLREPTSYNTYLIAGLPPTPIALPGRAAIHAALQPTDDDSLYFVARGDGSHEFSKTFNEHQRAVRHYILGQPK